MNTLTVKAQWNIAKGKLKQKLARLMEDELEFTDGKEAELLGRIQKASAQEASGQVPAVATCCSCHHHQS